MAGEGDTKRFHIGDILSVTTSMLVSPRYMDGVYDLIGYIAGERPAVDELAEVMADCKRHLLQLYPQLGEIDAESVEFENWRPWLDKQKAEFGEWFEVKRPQARD